MISPPSAVAEVIEITDTDASSIKTVTVLRIAQPGINNDEGVSDMNVDPVGSLQDSGNSRVNAYCEDKLGSLIGVELQISAEMGEEYFIQILGEQSKSSGASVTVQCGIEENSEEGGRMHLISTLVKTLIGNGDEISVGIASGESPVKHSVGVVFGIGEEEEALVGEQLCQKRSKSDIDGESRLTTLTGGQTNEIGLSEKDPLVGQGTSTGRVDMPLRNDTSLGFELRPGEKLSAHGILP